MAATTEPGELQATQDITLHAPSARNALSVFLLSGLLMSFTGAILPAWGYHLKEDYAEVGRYFLALAAGLTASVPLGAALHCRKDVRTVVTVGSALACFAFVWLALASPPAHWAWRVAGVVLLGLAAGLLNSSAFQSISGCYELDRPSTVNIAGMLFGLGCLLMSLLVYSVFYVYTVSSTLLLVAAIPGFAAGLYARAAFAKPVTHHTKTWREVWDEVKSPGAVLFSLVLFFQLGNEWSIAGWLPIFLVQRIGVSPPASLLILTFFWLALLVGRVASQALLPHLKHGRILLASIFSALFGLLILLSTNNRFGAWVGVLFLGLGFAAVYPLLVERIAHRFPDYHPGFFNGLLSFGITGGLLAPWALGFIANWMGIRAVMLVPMLGSLMVFLLILLLWLEAKLTA